MNIFNSLLKTRVHWNNYLISFMTHALALLLFHFSFRVHWNFTTRNFISRVAIFSSNVIKRKDWTHRQTPKLNYASVRKDIALGLVSLSRDDICYRLCCNSDTLADKHWFRMPINFPAWWLLKCECNSDTNPEKENEREFIMMTMIMVLQWITHNMGI